jgi:hypothetical protein
VSVTPAVRGIPAIDNALHGFPPGYMEGVIARGKANANTHTKLAHQSGMKKLTVFAEEMGWVYPFIPMDNPQRGLFRLLAYIDYLSFQCNLSCDSVRQAYTNTKIWHLENMPFLEGGYTGCGPWGEKGSHPALISASLHNLQPSLMKGRFPIPRAWIKEGFHEWPRDVWVAIFVIHGWLGRKSEFLHSPTPQHRVTWGMLEFCFLDRSGEPVVMARNLILSTPCDLVRMKPESRKAQPRGKVREIPWRVNFTKLANVASGLDKWCNGDMATVLQAHYVTSQAYRKTDEQLKVTPILTFLGDKTFSAEKLVVYLKAKAVSNRVDPDTVTLHCLRTGQVTDLVNGELNNNPVAMLAVSGHVSLETQKPYQRLKLGIAKDVTDALKF